MSVLRIYADEAGSIPVEDSDSVFVVAAVSVIGQHPTFDTAIGRPQWLVDRIAEIGGDLHCRFVQPTNGYGHRLSKKMSKMDTMARTTRLLTGANAHYLPTNRGLQTRNLIYQYCMQALFQEPLVRAISRSGIDSVEFYLDQMTMPRQSRGLFVTHIRGMRDRLIETITSISHQNPSRSEILLSNIQFSDIAVKWSDEADTQPAHAGLTLAHYLASQTRDDMLRGRTNLYDLFKERGFQLNSEDITTLLLKPISKNAIETWRIRTGLIEPNV